VRLRKWFVGVVHDGRCRLGDDRAQRHVVGVEQRRIVGRGQLGRQPGDGVGHPPR
jgi:hypothetical protein